MLYQLNRFWIFSLTLLALSQASLIAQQVDSQPSAALEGLIDKIVAPYLEEGNTQSLSVGIIDNVHDYHYYYGTLSASNAIAPNEEKMYALGSASKIFTAYLMMKLVEEEQLALDKPLNAFFPNQLDNPVLQKLNPHLLASHQTGLPDKPQNFHTAEKNARNPYAHYTETFSFEYLNTYRDSKKNYPIGSFRFSNYNYLVLGQILESVSKSSFSSLFNQYIVDEIGLKNISVDLPADLVDVATPHSVIGKELVPWQFNRYSSSMGIYASLPASLSFLRTWIGASNSSEWDLIQECMMEQTSTDKKHVSAGYGWFIFPRSKKAAPLYTVSGKTDGSWCYFAMIPKTKTAVVVLSNSKHSVDELGIEIMDLLNR